MKQTLKFLLELGPLLIFFAIYKYYGIFTATGVFMVISIISLAASWFLLGTISQMQLMTTAIIVVMGGMTLYFQNADFVYLKPTIVYLLFASLLLGGLYFKKVLLKSALGEAIALEDAGWRILTIRWGLFFLALAIINEILRINIHWGNITEDNWVTFKTFGFLPLTILFAITQVSTMLKYQVEDEKS